MGKLAVMNFDPKIDPTTRSKNADDKICLASSEHKDLTKERVFSSIENALWRGI